MGTHKIAEKYKCNQSAVYYYFSKKFVIDASEAAVKDGRKESRTLKPHPKSKGEHYGRYIKTYIKQAGFTGQLC
jgi:hypothetical protein